MEDDSNGERISPAQWAFRRRLGVTLNRVRSRLTEFTQATIAERLGVDTETVGRWERGGREPRVYQLAVMAEAYELPNEVAAWFVFPTDSISELDARISEIRALQLRQVASEVAAAQVRVEALPAGAGRAARHGKRPA